MKSKKLYLELLKKSLVMYAPVPRNLILFMQRLIGEADTVLDVGCGMKSLTRNIVCAELTGIDLCEDYLSKKDVKGDVRNLRKIFKWKRFDVLLCIDMIEHLTRKEGLKLLKDMEELSRKRIIVATPARWTKNIDGVMNQANWSFGNRLDYHQSLWKKEDFLKRGYELRTKGLSGEMILAFKEMP